MAFLKLCTNMLWLAILVMIISFFLPWVRIQANLLRPLEEAQKAGWGDMFGNLKESILSQKDSLERSGYKLQTQGTLQASGFEIPRLVNTDDSQLALAFVELFTDKASGAQWKCYIVYAVPGIAMVLGLLYQFAQGPRWGPLRKFPMVVSLCAATIFLAALYKINHARLDHLVVQIEFCYGIWLSLFAYATIAIAAFLGTIALCFVRSKTPR